MVIYADVVFLINFLMDSFIIFLTLKLVKIKRSKILIIFGGLIGSLLYCLLMFFEPISKFYNPFTSLFIFLIPIIVVFKPKSFFELAKYFITLNICAFFVGGVATAFFFYSNMTNYLGELLEFTMTDFPIKLLIFSCSFTYICIKIYRIILSEKMNKKAHIVNVLVKDKGEKETFNALIDTGNTLKEPIKNSNVIIAEFSVVKKFLPDEIKLLFYENKESDTAKIYQVISEITDINFISNFRLLPFKSVGNENGTLISFKVESVKIFDELKTYELKDVYIAVVNFKLTENNEFSGLINPSSLEERISV